MKGPNYLAKHICKNSQNVNLDSNIIALKSFTYDPAMLPSCEKQLTKASATARFAGGRGIELLTQVRIMTYPLKLNAIKKLRDLNQRVEKP